MLKMKNITESLLAARQIITDKELILYTLGGLGQEHEFVVVNLTSRQDNVTLQEVQYMLQTQEMLLEQLTSVSTVEAHSAQANVANFKRTGYNGGSQNYGRGGYNNQRGRGRNSYGRGTGQGRGGNRPACQLCGRVGHVALKCYHKFYISFNGSPNGDNETQHS